MTVRFCPGGPCPYSLKEEHLVYTEDTGERYLVGVLEGEGGGSADCVHPARLLRSWRIGRVVDAVACKASYRGSIPLSASGHGS